MYGEGNTRKGMRRNRRTPVMVGSGVSRGEETEGMKRGGRQRKIDQDEGRKRRKGKEGCVMPMKNYTSDRDS